MSGTKSCPGAGSWLKGTDGEREGKMDPNQMKFISLIPSQFAGDTHTIAYIYIYCWFGRRSFGHYIFHPFSRSISCTILPLAVDRQLRANELPQTPLFFLCWSSGHNKNHSSLPFHTDKQLFTSFSKAQWPWLWIGRKWFIIC